MTFNSDYHRVQMISQGNTFNNKTIFNDPLKIGDVQDFLV